MTFRNLISTYFSVTDIACCPNPHDFPGKRFAGLDFSYRLPYLRNWLTLYTDNITSDDVNPLVNPSRASYNPGLYLSQIPRLPSSIVLSSLTPVPSDRHIQVSFTMRVHEQGLSDRQYGRQAGGCFRREQYLLDFRPKTRTSRLAQRNREQRTGPRWRPAGFGTGESRLVRSKTGGTLGLVPTGALGDSVPGCRPTEQQHDFS